MYKAETLLNFKKPNGAFICPLEWWEGRAGIFPKLREMAMILLGVSIASTSSEHIFRLAKNIIRD